MSMGTTYRETEETHAWSREWVDTRLRAAADWLLRSFEVCGRTGSSAFYSRFFFPIKGWAPPYPETTGYIIPTLLRYARRLGPCAGDVYRRAAMEMAEWVLGLQVADGSLPGGFAGSPHQPSVFNTGQMIKGLLAAHEESGEARFLEGAAHAADWLARGLGEDGTWSAGNYKNGFSPSYYTRVAWPMLMVWRKTGEGLLRDTAVRALDLIRTRQQKNGSIAGWGFSPQAPGFTHTIAYTIRGFLESALLLGREYEGAPYWKTGKKSAMALFKRLRLQGKLAGQYRRDWTPIGWYACLTGNCQSGLTWLLIHGQEYDPRLLDAAVKTIATVAGRQRLRGSANVAGAIAGSSPVWGRYLALRYPNWAAKFYMDSLESAFEALEKERRLCAGAGS